MVVPLTKNLTQLEYNGRKKHRVLYTCLSFIPDKMKYGEEQYRPNSKYRYCNAWTRCVYNPQEKAQVDSGSDAWKRYILYDSHGFIHPGIE